MVTSILPLHLSGASVVKRGKTIVGPIDLELGSTGTTIIMGPNGSGKTTLLKLMHGLERSRSGSVDWALDVHEARHRQAFVFQTPIVLRRNALDNVAYPLRLRGMSKSQANEKALTWLQRIDLEDAQNLNAKLLSGGERQKLAIARALAVGPEVLFLDEPTSNLDGQSTREIEALISEAVGNGIRVIMTTHDFGQGKRLADDVIFLLKGKIHERNAGDTFFGSPTTPEAKAFLAGDIVD